MLGPDLVPQGVVAWRSDQSHPILHLPGDDGPDQVDGAARSLGGGLPHIGVQVDTVKPRGYLPLQKYNEFLSCVDNLSL